MNRQIALDTETTGKNDDGTPGDHRIIQVGCVEIVDRRLTGRQLHFLVNPGRPVDAEAAAVHGYTWEMLQGCPSFGKIAPELIDFIRGSELLIHNAKFDTAFLDKEWALLGLRESTADLAKITDTVTLAMKLCPGHHVNLDNLCRLYHIDNSSRSLHGALLDAQLLAEVYLAMTGGQEHLVFEDIKMKAAERWKRPQGAVLPRMQAEPECEAQHVAALLELAQGSAVKAGMEHAVSAWGDEYTLGVPRRAEGEDKKSYQARLKAVREQALKTLLTAQQQEAYAAFCRQDEAERRAWEDRVAGKVKN